MESIIALLACLLTAFSLIPQTIEAVHDRDITHLSKSSFVIICISSFLWILHGSNIRDSAIIFANVVVFACSVTILILMIKKGKKTSVKRHTTVRRR